MDIFIDYEAIKNAGGAVYSKYGTVKNSKDLKLPEELRKALTDDTWLRETGPGTITLESGDMSAFEEQLIGEYKGDNCLRLLRMCNLVGKESNAYIAGQAKLKLYNMVREEEPAVAPKKEERPKYAIDVHFPKGFDFDVYRKNRSLSMIADQEEKACNKEKILRMMRGCGVKGAELYLSPWRWGRISYKRSWDEIEDTFERYDAQLKSRILEMYLDISKMDEVSPSNKSVICKWAAKMLWEQPYADDKVKSCRCYAKLAENGEQERIIYSNHLYELRDSTEEESFLILKRLESYNVSEVPYYLGIKYLEGYGCERDYQEAKRCFVKGMGQGPENLRELCAGMVSYATRKGDSYELFKIAMKKIETELFEEGISQLIKLADVDKLEEARYELAKIYENGYRVKKNEQQALVYYEKAAETGYEKAIRKMISVYEEEQLGLDRRSYREKQEYQEQIEKWKRKLVNPLRKDYKKM
ncbi:MAG: sel1 repeat family protein [Lachnospiraceae bacterium]|nr:sel1 repeat family protein [Lachnospiraceae bacterium]